MLFQTYIRLWWKLGLYQVGEIANHCENMSLKYRPPARYTKSPSFTSTTLSQMCVWPFEFIICQKLSQNQFWAGIHTCKRPLDQKGLRVQVDWKGVPNLVSIQKKCRYEQRGFKKDACSCRCQQTRWKKWKKRSAVIELPYFLECWA